MVEQYLAVQVIVSYTATENMLRASSHATISKGKRNLDLQRKGKR